MAKQTIAQITERLARPFDISDIEFLGKGNGSTIIAAPYVTNRAIQSRLDEVVGINNWKNEFKAAPNGGVLCGIYIRFGSEWVVKWDGADNTNIESTKGGLSGSMKRAAVQWGIGRFLYDTPRIWVEAERYTFNGKQKSKLGKKGMEIARDQLKKWIDAFLRPYEPAVLVDKLKSRERPKRYSAIDPSKTEAVLQRFEKEEVEAIFGKMTNGAIIAISAWLLGEPHYVNVELELLKDAIKEWQGESNDGSK